MKPITSAWSRATRYATVDSRLQVRQSEHTRILRQRKVILIDGNNILYHYFDPVRGTHEDQSGALHGFMGMLRRMDQVHQPMWMCVLFDSPVRRTHRHAVLPGYKTGRKPTPRALRCQMARAADELEKVKVNSFVVPGCEADDLIAAYTEAFTQKHTDVMIVSNDNDFLQLARGSVRTPATNPDESTTTETAVEDAEPGAFNPLVELYQPNKRRYIRERHIVQRFGVLPSQLPDYMALRGGKNPDTLRFQDDLVVSLLQKYESVPKLLRSLNEIDNSVLRQTLKHAMNDIEVALRIAKLNQRVPLPKPLEALYSPPALDSLSKGP